MIVGIIGLFLTACGTIIPLFRDNKKKSVAVIIITAFLFSAWEFVEGIKSTINSQQIIEDKLNRSLHYFDSLNSKLAILHNHMQEEFMTQQKILIADKNLEMNDSFISKDVTRILKPFSPFSFSFQVDVPFQDDFFSQTLINNTNNILCNNGETYLNDDKSLQETNISDIPKFLLYADSIASFDVDDDKEYQKNINSYFDFSINFYDNLVESSIPICSLETVNPDQNPNGEIEIDYQKKIIHLVLFCEKNFVIE